MMQSAILQKGDDCNSANTPKELLQESTVECVCVCMGVCVGVDAWMYMHVLHTVFFMCLPEGNHVGSQHVT